jgi:drug/metabolite transporter (DMT)-like permease
VNWVVISLTAAGFQTARNSFARSLVGHVSPALNSWSRFAFNLPFSVLLAATLIGLHGWPNLPIFFFAYCLATAVTQLLGNVALVAAFGRSNFAQSIVLHKLEVVVTGIVGVLLFAESPSPIGWAGLITCTAGVLLMNLGRASGPAGWRRAFHLDAGSLLALSAAILLTLAAFMLKDAVAVFVAGNPRVGPDRFEAAAHTLVHSTWMEVVILSAWLLRRGLGELRKVPLHWKRMLAIGLTGFCGSLGWYWAFSLTLAAYVKAVGQIEAVFAVILAIVVWHEKEVWKQLPGILLIMLGIVLVLID